MGCSQIDPETTNLDPDALLPKSSTFDFARLLLDSVRRRCSTHNAPTHEHGNGSFAWGSTGDAQPWNQRDEAECCAVIENLFFDSIPRQHVMILGTENVANPGASKRFLQHIQDENLCVGVTFHGAQPEHVEGIMREGTLPEDWGIYIGAHAGVAHLHTDPDQRGRRYLCVLLTATTQTAGDNRQPRSGSPKLGEANALDRLANQTYYGPAGEDRILVSHLITYSLCAGSRKRVGGGFDDPFLRRLSSAVQRAGSVPVRGQRSNSRPRGSGLRSRGANRP